jgi:hypothetical protein
MTFDEEERSVLAGLADVLIPASAGFPSARQAGVAGEGLDRVLAVRPDLEQGLKQRLQSAEGCDPAAVVLELRASDPGAFAALAELVAGAYFLNEEVRAGLDYQGQGPRSHESGSIDQGLLKPVIDRGRTYRPTPEMKGQP